jgi:hypothetical protein
MNGPFRPGSTVQAHAPANDQRSLERRAKMKTAIATVLMTVLFLSAGAFANVNHDSPPPALTHNDNVTVIEKNDVWPPVAQFRVMSCNETRCFDI